MDDKMITINESGAFQLNRSMYIGKAEPLQERTLRVVWVGNENESYDFDFLATNITGAVIPGIKHVMEVHYNEPVYGLEATEQQVNKLITEIYLPKETKKIASVFLAKAINLKEITLPPTLESIQEEAFAESGLLMVKIPDTVKNIYPYAFAGCENAEIYLPATVENIGNDVFAGVKKLHYSGDLAGAPWGAQEWIKD